jgi:hypothetical protein
MRNSRVERLSPDKATSSLSTTRSSLNDSAGAGSVRAVLSRLRVADPDFMNSGGETRSGGLERIDLLNY